MAILNLLMAGQVLPSVSHITGGMRGIWKHFMTHQRNPRILKVSKRLSDSHLLYSTHKKKQNKKHFRTQ